MANTSMVIFVFDGVIADSWWLAHKTSQKEYPGITTEEYRHGFEGNIYDTQDKWAHLEKRVVDYFAEYKKEMHLVEFFEIKSVLRRLAEKYLLSIVSSATSEVINFYLDREGLQDCFTDILGADVHKNKHIKIEILFSKHNLKPTDCVMITDTSGDIREARLAGVDTIAVTWGFHDRARLENEHPYHIVSKPDQLPMAIDSYFTR